MSDHLFIVRQGDQNKPRLVFLHGFLGNSHDWQAVTSLLSDNFSISAIDLPGHGRSINQGPYRLAEIEQALAAEERIHCLVGYSMGGRIGLQIAVRNKVKVERFVFESVSAGLKTERERLTRLTSEQKWHNLLNDDSVSMKEFLAEWYRQPVFSHLQGQQELLMQLYQKRQANNKPALARALAAFSLGRQGDLWQKLKKIEQPVLLISGSQDLKFQQLHSAMADLLPNAKNEVLPAGHNVHDENPAAFARALRSFLSL